MKTDGSLISEMDLFHHRPYECLLLGYINGKVCYTVTYLVLHECLVNFTLMFSHILYCQDEYDASTSPLRYPKNGEVIISIPGAYSRKPPILSILFLL